MRAEVRVHHGNYNNYVPGFSMAGHVPSMSRPVPGLSQVYTILLSRVRHALGRLHAVYPSRYRD